MMKILQQRKLYYTAITSLLLFLIAVYGWGKFSAHNDKVQLVSSQTHSEHSDAQSGQTGTGQSFFHNHFQTGLEALPTWLEGADVDGETLVDGNGNLVISRGLRRFFDYFLLSRDAEPNRTIKARVEAQLRQRLSKFPAALTQASSLFDRYLNYKIATRALEAMLSSDQGKKDIDTLVEKYKQDNTPAALKLRKEKIRALRANYFSSQEATAFFGEDDIQVDFQETLNYIQLNPQLNEIEKTKRINAAIANLPAKMQEAMRPTLLLQNLETLTAEIQARGGSAQELRAMRLKLVGEAATQRLENLDQEDNAWDGKVQRFFAQRKVIMNSPSYNALERTTAIQRLLEQSFSPEEQLRLLAYDPSIESELPNSSVNN